MKNLMITAGLALALATGELEAMPLGPSGPITTGPTWTGCAAGYESFGMWSVSVLCRSIDPRYSRYDPRTDPFTPENIARTRAYTQSREYQRQMQQQVLNSVGPAFWMFGGYAGNQPSYGGAIGDLSWIGRLAGGWQGSWRSAEAEAVLPGDKNVERSARATLAERLAALESRRAAYYYRDAALLGLRKEYNRGVLRTLLRDPGFAHAHYYVTASSEQILKGLPSYDDVIDMQNQINSWKETTNRQILVNRYQYRARLEETRQRLGEEFANFLLQNPAWAKSLSRSSEYMAARQNVLLNQENVRKWFADWTARYEKAVRESATAQAIDRDFQQLRRDFPDLDRYLNLAAEANSILEGFRGHKAIAAYAAQVRILASDPYYVRDSSQLGALFQRRIGALLDATNYKATIELHEERLAALMAADAGLSSASQTQSAADANLRAYTSQVYRAVQTCLNQYGASCNPYLFAPAMALVNDPANIAVIDRTANLAEDAGTASFNFSTSEKYKALADSSARAVQDDLAKVQAYIEQAVRDYLSAYNALPAVRAVEQLWEELIGILFSESRRLGVVAAEIESLLRKLANQ